MSDSRSTAETLREGRKPSATDAQRARFLEAMFSAIPDFVYAFDRERRFVYANPAMLALFGLSAGDMVGKTFADLDYPPDLASLLNKHIDRILADGVTVEDEVFFRSPSGRAAYFAHLWAPIRGEDGSVEMVVGVARDTSERRMFEDALRKNEARLRAASELVGLGVYSWDPVSGALEWDDRLRAMWGLPVGAVMDMDVLEAGIHCDDLARVREAIASCVSPAGDGRYNIEHRLKRRGDGALRRVAAAGRATFKRGRAVGVIGAAIDVTAQRAAEAATRASEAQFRSFADHSRNMIWIGDPVAETILYRSAAYERMWGLPCGEGPTGLTEWMKAVHPDDRPHVEHALGSVRNGEVVTYEYRIIRPADGALRWLRDTSFPIPDHEGAITRFGGITEDLSPEDLRRVYIVSASARETRMLRRLLQTLGYRARGFETASAFLSIAAVLAPGCVLIDLRSANTEGLFILRELKARSSALPTIALDGSGGGAAAAVAAMKAGAIDYLIVEDEASLEKKLANALAECQAPSPLATPEESASARLARLTSREREVLVGLVNGGTNKIIGQTLGISPRTVEMHRAQVMNRLDASNLSELLKIAFAAGLTPARGGASRRQKP
ncbi:PAS domain S-box protein [Chelatococcus sambhunathii]|uniref:histidine kinase n=1 Tax=Chelatococcus sambhunathii TaxID=363953 RepID=A0ABU1DIG3_9HYPH|nr:PAS domain S-box protein [Chelatococcus sambhunathii]MDR4307700.1 PAS domain S-box protein [Chelatococcus sambhunathii]